MLHIQKKMLKYLIKIYSDSKWNQKEGLNSEIESDINYYIYDPVQKNIQRKKD